ncbi:hypothetical protein BHE74_00028919 [Ensete ventricosum]|nr:hypothetical protein BHE74_00028919 [Ensete ventricosum]
MPSDHNQTGCVGCLSMCTGEGGRSAARVGSFGGQPTPIGWFGDAPGRSPCQSAVRFGAAAATRPDHVTENAYESVRQQRSTSQAAKIEMAAAYSEQLLSEPMLAPHSCPPLSSVSFGSPAFTRSGPDHRRRVRSALLEFQRVEHWSRELLEEYSKLRNILSSMMFEERSIVSRKQQASFIFLSFPNDKNVLISAVVVDQVNVVKGLKLYEDIFTNSELLTLADFINELRLAGCRGELCGKISLKLSHSDSTGNIEPIPTALQTVIDHLVQWRLIPESRKPNSCIINFFDEVKSLFLIVSWRSYALDFLHAPLLVVLQDEHSQPYFKPPHLDTPISTLLLSDTTMAFGRSLVSDHEGNYKGPLTLSINQGSLLVMRGNSADMARHVVCASPNRRIIITFVKVRAAGHPADSPTALQQPSKTMALWQPAQKVATAGIIACGPHAMIPAAWGLALRSPVVMLPPPRAMVMSPNKKAPRGGTGVFLPWTVGPKKYTRHLPPRIQKRRLPSLPSPLEVQA